jgi:heme/copper-type cytochrome/quinol oxidase subunit 2
MNQLRIGLAGLLAIVAATVIMPAQETREITMTARKYEFEPKAVKVKKGDHVKLVVRAADHDHGFKLDAFHIDQKVPKGESVTIEFNADQTGTFPFECSHFCGLGHKKMKGQLAVE